MVGSHVLSIEDKEELGGGGAVKDEELQTHILIFHGVELF